MRVDILTLFPNMFEGPFSESIVSRASKKGFLTIHIHNIRDYATDRHKSVDDMSYGGGVGMVMRVDVIDRALRDLKLKIKNSPASPSDPSSTESRRGREAGRAKLKIILLTPQGKVYNQKIAQSLSKLNNLILICGHYEGFDERIRKLVDMEISIGDYILTGGEIPAMVLVDTIARLIPGVLGKEESLVNESFSKIDNKILLEYPQYTRPEIYNGWKVPKVLLSGNHQKIAQWRQKQALKRTKKRRPDLLK